MAACLRGEPQFLEWVHRRFDGTEFPSEVSLNTFEVGGTPYLQAIVRDITDRSEAEKKVEESRERYISLFRQSHDGIILHDTDGNILEVNDMTLEQLGYAEEELLALRIADLHPREALLLPLDRLDQRTHRRRDIVGVLGGLLSVFVVLILGLRGLGLAGFSRAGRRGGLSEQPSNVLERVPHRSQHR